jgi:Immune inhibitor A peptidase M6
MRRTARWCAVAAVAALAVTPTTTALAGTSGSKAQRATSATKAAAAKAARSDIRGTGVDYHGGKALPMTKALVRAENRRSLAAAATAAVGDVAEWLALDDFNGRLYLKTYKLMGDGEHIQIWVASDAAGNEALSFPAGDCRNTMGGGAAITVTQAQVDSFVSEFDTNMFPKESEAFSVAPDRDGTNGDFGQDGPGNKTVTLVDNVRDSNYFAPTTPDGQTYIAGFFSSQFNDLTDRNIMTIDSFDWLHRTGAAPPDDSAQADYAACTAALGGSRPFGVARPRLYEGTFAHEYQHLLESYVDPDEVNFVNEGLSDWAQTLVGYVDPNQLPTSPTADSHIACFQGFLGANFGGPENSLTQWQDQGGPEILCDYGAAYTFMEYLHGRFGGDAFMSALHREPGNGLVGLQTVLNQFGFRGITAQDVVHQWLAMVAVDNQIDTGARLRGGARRDYTSPTLHSVINFASDQAFASPGAPPNGADFVRLGDRRGFVTAKRLRSLSFTGSGSFTPAPVEWTTDDGRLFSGAGDGFNRAITRSVTVPASGDLTLSADLQWGTELGWDFGFVQVYDQATDTWKSLPSVGAGTTSEHDPGADPNIVANMPGFTGPETLGDLSPITNESFDLTAYAGQTIEIAFRYMTDSSVTGPGFWVDNVKVGGQLVSDGTDLAAWQSPTQAHPVKVAGWTVQLVAYGNGKKAFVGKLPVRYNADRDQFTASIGRDVARYVGNSRKTTTVAALVTADDPTETAPGYPVYELRANNILQPGGS